MYLVIEMDTARSYGSLMKTMYSELSNQLARPSDALAMGNSDPIARDIMAKARVTVGKCWKVNSIQIGYTSGHLRMYYTSLDMISFITHRNVIIL